MTLAVTLAISLSLSGATAEMPAPQGIVAVCKAQYRRAMPAVRPSTYYTHMYAKYLGWRVITGNLVFVEQQETDQLHAAVPRLVVGECRPYEER